MPIELLRTLLYIAIHYMDRKYCIPDENSPEHFLPFLPFSSNFPFDVAGTWGFAVKHSDLLLSRDILIGQYCKRPVCYCHVMKTKTGLNRYKGGYLDLSHLTELKIYI